MPTDKQVNNEDIHLKVLRHIEGNPEVTQRELARMLGVSLGPGEPRGLVVKSVRAGSGAERIGIESGDWILGINGKAMEDEDDLQRAALDLRGRTRALVVVQRGRGRYHVTVPLS